MTTEPKLAPEQLDALDNDENVDIDVSNLASDAPNLELSEDMEVMSPGQMLKEGREKHELSIDEVAERLKLRKQLIEDIENDKLDEKLNQTFAKGYLRSYARLVEVPEEQVFAGLSYLATAQEQRLEMHSFSKGIKHKNSDSHLLRNTMIVIFVLLVAGGYWWWEQNKATILGSNIDANTQTQSQIVLPSNVSSEPVALKPEPVAVKPTVQPQAPVVNREASTEPSAANLGLSTGEPTTPMAQEPTVASVQEAQTAIETGTQLASDLEEQNTAALLQQSSNENAVAANEESSADTNSLNFTFAQECWVEVRDASGKRLVVGVKQPGSEINLDGQAPYSVVLGTSSGVEITYQGNKIDLSEFSDGKVVRLKIPSNS